MSRNGTEYVHQYMGHNYLIRVDMTARTVSARAKFAGKWYTGIARCHADDIFKVETGLDLAILRCDLKINKAKIRRGEERLAQTLEMKKSIEISERLDRDYLSKASIDLSLTEGKLKKYIEEIYNNA